MCTVRLHVSCKKSRLEEDHAEAGQQLLFIRMWYNYMSRSMKMQR